MSIATNGVNNTVIKPQIYLIGTIVKGGSYSQLVDNDIHTYASTGLTFTGTTQLDEDNILSFNDQVRIIITGQMTPKPTYQEKNGDGSLGSLKFEGNETFNTQINNVNEYAETWFTFNNKEPIRTRSHFYNFTDMDDRTVEDPSAGVTDNLNNLGFVLKLSPTGSPLITLKARTYFRGEVSRTAIAVFRLIYPQDDKNSRQIYQNTWASN